MAKNKGLPKKYARMGFKRGWKAYKLSLKRPTRSYSKPVKRRKTVNMARRKKYYRRAKAGIMNKSFIDGAMSAGGKIVIRKVVGGGVVYEAGLDVLLGMFRHNKTLLAQGIINGVTAFLPSLNLGSGGNGGGVR